MCRNGMLRVAKAVWSVVAFWLGGEAAHSPAF